MYAASVSGSRHVGLPSAPWDRVSGVHASLEACRRSVALLLSYLESPRRDEVAAIEDLDALLEQHLAEAAQRGRRVRCDVERLSAIISPTSYATAPASLPTA